MTTGFLNSLLELLKLAPRYLVALGIACAFLVFAPPHWLQYLGIHDFAQQYRQHLSIAFILIGALFGVDRAIAIGGWVRYKMLVRKREQRRLQRLHGLTEDEKQILRYYIAKQTKTNVLRFDDGVVQGLVAEDIIYQSATVGSILEGFAYIISDFAWDYLHENIHLLEGTTNIMRTDKRILFDF